MRNRYNALFVLFLVFFLGCEREIFLELEEEDRKVVIEGWLNSMNEPSRFSVGYSGSFFDSGEMEMIPGARIVVRDDFGNAHTLQEIEPGIHETNGFQVVQERDYTVEAEVNGVVYTASNYMPRINNINYAIPFYSDTIVFGEGYYVTMSANEPAGIGDYYQFRIYQNDSLFDSPFDILVSDDRLVDGQESFFLYPYPFEEGDTVVVEIRGISELTYSYYISYIQQASSGGGPFGSPPANLVTNWDNGALGFFGTAATVRDTIIME